MERNHLLFQEMEADEVVPEHLKTALVSEIDTIRNSMEVVTHFTESLLSTFLSVLAIDTSEQ
jgi:hypothetical protein